MTSFPALSRDDDRQVDATRIARAVRTSSGTTHDLDEIGRWIDEQRPGMSTDAEIVPLGQLAGWRLDPASGVLGHQSGRFFTVEGLRISMPGNAVPEWDQPILNQPEIGILGLLVREAGGALECLVQAKAEPGNRNGIQISPTVQATSSNQAQVHGGAAIPYLEYFVDARRHRVITDVLQSEQGAWFLGKRNRNVVVEVDDPLEPLPGFRWLPVGLLHQLLAVDDLVNMDTRTVLSCLPFAASDVAVRREAPGSGFPRSVLRSGDERSGCLIPTGKILSWITERRSACRIERTPMPLTELSGWRFTDAAIVHETGQFFEVIGVDVHATGREVARWSQPMLAARGTGLVAFLVRQISGVLHVLVQLRREPGIPGGVELAPTVQCTPDSYAHVPELPRPPFLDEVLGARPEQVRFDTFLSDEGGRFFHTRSRHLIVETDMAYDHPDYRWMACHQLDALLRHSDYINMQARSLLACLRSQAVSDGPRWRRG
ncbi:NDP-hexose 2,3-dehydratase family protein [Phytoactinopolyspora limicola]|uniref:NDP-hexose 2,3-dehydratase family protein n=1 Tax=Phytoactinopolyspora limicola TaxID=2715536 RepID=UPI00140D2E91|nr:NDP-hexose 2,3-dehydratase family protein [Phytoactinopolyspora limicola]